MMTLQGGWEGGSGGRGERIHVADSLFIVHQKLTQQSKAIILQKKKRIQPDILQGDRV